METTDGLEPQPSDKLPKKTVTVRKGKKVTNVAASPEGDVAVFVTEDIMTNIEKGYWAKARLVYGFNAAGTTFQCHITHYQASNNNRYKGQVWLTFKSGNNEYQPYALTDRAHQTNVWIDLVAGKTIQTNGQLVYLRFDFRYDYSGGHLYLKAEKNYPVPLAVPIVSQVKNFTGSPLTVTGEGGFPGGTVVLLDGATTKGTGDVKPDGKWEVTVPGDSVSFTAHQQVASNASLKTPVMTSYRAALTSPTENELVPAKDLTFKGIAAPNTSMKVVRHGVGTAWANPVNTGGTTNWQALALATVHFPSGPTQATVEIDGAQRYTNIVTFNLLGYPVITHPGNNTEQEQTFTVSGNNRLANASVKVFINPTERLVGTAPAAATVTWATTVTLEPGVNWLAAQGLISGKQSGSGDAVLYKIRPAKPTLSYRPKGESIEFYGTGYPGGRTDIHVSGDSVNYISVDIPPSGNYTKDLPPSVAPGSYRYSARQSVSNGGSGRIYSSDWAPEITVSVPTPKLTAVDVTRNGQKLTFFGRGQQWGTNRVVAVILNDDVDMGAKVLHAVVQTNLTWTTTSISDLAPGNYTKLSAKQWVNGVWSTAVAVRAVVIPSPSPLLVDPPGPTGQRPQIRGSAWPASIIVLQIPGQDPVTLNPAGAAFYLNATYDWPPGVYIIRATAEFCGQTSLPATQTFTVKTPLPVITTTGVISIFTVITGTGWPTCWVFIYSSANELLGSGRVGDNGIYTVNLGERAPGPLTIYAILKQTETSDNVSDQTAARTLTVAVPKALILMPPVNGRPGRKSEISGTADSTQGTIELTKKGEAQPFMTGIPLRAGGSWKAMVELAEGPTTMEARLRYKNFLSEPIERAMTVVPNVPVVDTPLDAENLGKMLRISGTGFTGDEVVVQRTGSPHTFPTTVVKPDSTWSLLVQHNMVAGNGLRALARAAPGLDSVWSEVKIPTLLKLAPDIFEPRGGDYVGTLPTYRGLAEPRAFVTVSQWFDVSSKLAPPTQADSYGRWEVVGTTALAEGANRVAVCQSLDGVNSEWVVSGRFNVERAASNFDAPTVDYPPEEDEVGLHPEYSGEGLPGAVIKIIKVNDATTVLATALVDRDGRWAVRSQIALPPGLFTYSVNQSRDGATSKWLLPNRTIKVTQVVANFAAPVINKPVNDANQILERSVLFEGDGCPGADVTVYRNHVPGTVYATTRVNADGKWSVRSELLVVQGDARPAVATQKMDGQTSAVSNGPTLFRVGEILEAPVCIYPPPDAYVSPNTEVAGTAMPGVTVRLYKHLTPDIIGVGVTDESGVWKIAVRNLPLGEYAVGGRGDLTPLVSPWMQVVKVFVVDVG